ncbi:hypothetical protein [Algoriphagus sp.]|uniref:hypothetical protein n=1 Tax=Algoriphagus sp. TaxID=1872435 RepID=UPI0025F51005|nr:hypothetical protein [Algoriphagus sp.]
MKDLTPKSDLWSKIESRRDFESQLNDLSKKLPLREPKIDLWDQIERQLDQEQKVFPIWRYLSIAVSFVLIMAFGAIIYNNITSEKTDLDLVSETSTTEANSFDKTKELVESTEEEELFNAEKAEIQSSEKIRNESNRTLSKPVMVPKKPILFPKQDLKLISEAGVILNQPTEKPQTLHKVTISWGLNEKKKIRTQFGTNYSDPNLPQQLGRASESKNSIKIKFNKE